MKRQSAKSESSRITGITFDWTLARTSGRETPVALGLEVVEISGYVGVLNRSHIVGEDVT